MSEMGIIDALPSHEANLGPVRHSPAIGELAGALAMAQLKFASVVKKTVNPYFNSKYADLAQVISATQEALAEQGLVIVQFPIVREKEAGVDSWLAHKSGQWMARELLLPAQMKGKDGILKFDAQSVGSAVTYARRYAYQALIGVAAEIDDDGNAASNGGGSKEAAQAVAQRKISDHAKGAMPAAEGASQSEGKLALKIVSFLPMNSEWTQISGDGIGTLLAWLVINKKQFKSECMEFVDDGDPLFGFWRVKNANAAELQEMVISIGLEAKAAHSVALKPPESQHTASGEALANPIIRILRTGKATMWLRYGDVEVSCPNKHLWKYLTEGDGKPADLEVKQGADNPQTGKPYINVVAIHRIGDTSFTDNTPDLQQSLR